jgi:hypothetical protein
MPNNPAIVRVALAQRPELLEVALLTVNCVLLFGYSDRVGNDLRDMALQVKRTAVL